MAQSATGVLSTRYRREASPCVTETLFADLQQLKRGRVRLRAWIWIFGRRRNEIVLFRADQKDVMGLGIERQGSGTVDGFHDGDLADLVWRIRVEDVGRAGLAVAAVAAGRVHVSRFGIEDVSIDAD